MSNMTDGKKAVAAGDFAAAEPKLLKALDVHPDDGEVWFALMLCRGGYRDLGELTADIKRVYTDAAARGVPPETIFDSPCGKNAIRYATPARREKISALYGEIAELWKQKTGKTLKVPDLREKKRVPKSRIIFILAVVFAALAVVSGMFVILGLGTDALWAILAGAITLVIFALAALVLRSVAKRFGSSPRAVLPLLVGAAALTALGVLIVSLNTGNTALVVTSGIMLGVLALVGVFELIFGRKLKTEGPAQKPGRGKKSAAKAAAARDPELLMKRTQTGQKTSPRREEYVDEDD